MERSLRSSGVVVDASRKAVMKSAEAWSEELCGETSPQAIKRIQVDAIVHAIRVVAHNRQTAMGGLVRVLEALDPLCAELVSNPLDPNTTLGA